MAQRQRALNKAGYQDVAFKGQKDFAAAKTYLRFLRSLSHQKPNGALIN